MIRWDDLQILRTIDLLEQSEIGTLTNGQLLMMRIAEGQVLDHNRDYAPFVWELLVALNAGYVTWDDRGVYNQTTDPRYQANIWLQQIRDIRLTLSGRDRARGRVVIAPLPDPDEDDDRMIAGMTLEEIAREIGDTFTASQIPRFLRDSGIPDDALAGVGEADNWAYVMEVLERLHDGGSAARRSLREFVGRWLENRLHTGPRQEVQRRILAELGRQGWFVKESRLVIGEPQFNDVPVVSPVGRAARLAALHPRIRQAADTYVDRNLMSAAIFEAFKAVNIRVKELAGLDSDGADLMGKAFGGSAPLVKLADLNDQSGRDVQAGFLQIFTGAVRGIRNPNAHQQFAPLDDNEALEQLTFASMLMRRLDAAQATA